MSASRGAALGGVAGDVQKIVDAARPTLPRGTEIALRGQAATMKSSYFGLGVGVAVAIVLVYLLIVINFQSLLDPLIIISALPAALAGIGWMLFLTGTHLSVPALTGAIMTTGVATANSILLVSFARERLRQGSGPLSAALEAGATRIRPVLMTAFAMIVGMIPMALGLGEGAEQNAPLGRAVIGGLLFATFSTLLFVPLVFAGRAQPPRPPDRPDRANNKRRPRREQDQAPESRAEQRRRPSAPAAPPKGLARRDARRCWSSPCCWASARRGCWCSARRARPNWRRNRSKASAFSSPRSRRRRARSSGLLTLPATLRGDNETSIYARVNGYVRRFNVEIGDRVTKGEVLAELDTPELDQQVGQAAAQVEQAKANVVLGKVALERWKKLFAQDSVARAGPRHQEERL